jgi:hypothetical protein
LTILFIELEISFKELQSTFEVSHVHPVSIAKEGLISISEEYDIKNTSLYIGNSDMGNLGLHVIFPWNGMQFGYFF